jgi:hypothetical protein
VAPTSAPSIEPPSTARTESPSASAGKPALAPGPLEIEERSLAERLRTPLVSEDGKRVATGMSIGSSEDRLTLLCITDVDTDREVKSIVSQQGADLDRQLALVNEASAALDAQKWIPVSRYETAIDPTAKERSHGLGSAMAMEAGGEGLRVRFHEPTLIVDEASGRPWLRRAFPGWSKRGPVAGQSCVTFADLRGAWASRKLGVMVVEIGYSGSPHSCSFASELHVLRFAHP